MMYKGDQSQDPFVIHKYNISIYTKDCIFQSIYVVITLKHRISLKKICI